MPTKDLVSQATKKSSFEWVNSIKAAFNGLFSWIGKGFNALGTQFKNWGTNIKNNFIKLTSKAYATDENGNVIRGEVLGTNKLGNLDSNIKQASKLQTIINSIKNSKFGSTFNNMLQDAKTGFNFWMGSVENGLYRFRQGLYKFGDNVQSIFNNIFKQTSRKSTTTADGLLPQLVGNESDKTTSETVDSTSKARINGLKTLLNGFFSFARQGFDGLKTRITQTFGSSMDRISTSLKTLRTNLRNIFVKGTNRAYWTDENGNAHRAEVLKTNKVNVREANADDATVGRFQTLINNIKNSKLGATLSNVFQDAKTNFQYFASSVENTFNRFRLGISNLGSNISDVFSGLASYFKSFGSNISGMFSNIGTGVQKVFNNIKNSYIKATSKAYATDENGNVIRGEILDTNKPDVWDDSIKKASKFQTIINGIKNSKLGAQLSNMFQNAKTNFSYFALSVENAFRNLRLRIDGIKTSLGNAFKTGLGALNQFAASTHQAFNNLKVKISQAFGNISKSVGGMFNNLFGGKFTQSAQKVLNNLSTQFKSFGSSISGVFNNIINNIVGSKFVQSIQGVLNNLSVHFKSFGANIKGIFSNVASQIAGSNFTGKLKNLGTNIKNTFGNVAKSMSSFWSKFSFSKGTQETTEFGNEVNNTSKALAPYKDGVNNTSKALVPYKGNAVVAADATKKLGDNAKKSAEQTGNLGAQISHLFVNLALNAAIMGIFKLVSLITDAIKKFADDLYESFKEMEEGLDELKNNLESTESEISSLTSELEDIEDQIEEINSEPLSFTSEEELRRLRAESEELERQVALNETLKEQQQQQVNREAVETGQKYLITDSEGETFGDSIFNGAGTGAGVGASIGIGLAGISGVAGAVGTAFGAKAGAALGSFAGPIGTVLGLAAGAAIGAIVGGIIGGGAGAIDYALDDKPGEKIDSMKEEYDKLQEKYKQAQKKYQDDATEKNYEAYVEAQKQLSEYEGEMSDYMTKLSEYVNAIDWETATEDQKAYIIETNDTIDKWAVASGGKDAKYNAITRIFGENADQDLKNIDKQIKNSIKSGEDVDFDEIFNSKGLADTKERLDEIGISVVDLKYYYLDWLQVEEEVENSIYDTVQAVGGITDGITSLKDAFDEFTEGGLVTAKTLTELYDVFGTYEDAWENYVEIMASGTSSTKEAQEATEELLESFMNARLDQGPIGSMEEYLTLLGQLQNLGVTNAKEYVDALQKASVISSVGKDIVNQEKNLKELEKQYADGKISEEEYNERKEALSYTKEDFIKQYEEDYHVNLSDNERLVIEKAITAEKKEQDALVAQTKANEYDEAIRAKEEAETALNELYNEADKRAKDAGYEDVEDAIANNGSMYLGDFEVDGEVVGYTDAETMLKDKIDSIEVPAKIDVDNAEAEAEEAEKAFQQALDELGLTLNIELQLKSDLVDQLQEVYDTLYEAEKEYNENKGYVSVDTLQSLLELEPKYLAMLYDENGKLNLNKEAILQVAQARTLDMGIQAAQNVIEQASTALAGGKIDKLKELTEVTYDQADANWALVQSNLAALKTEIEAANLDPNNEMYGQLDGVYEGVESQVYAIQDLTNRAVANISNSFSSAGNTAKAEAEDAAAKQLEAFQEAMDYWENRIGANQARYEQIQNEIDLLDAKGKKAGKEYYEEQIELEEQRLELLENQKKEAQKYLGTFTEGSDEWFQ